jgi:hypothetical protein
MNLEEYIGKEVEITLIGLDHDELRTTGLVVSGESDNEGYLTYLRHNLPKSEWEWSGVRPIDSEEGYRYWSLDFQMDNIVWYKDIRVIGSITPKRYVKKHKV